MIIRSAIISDAPMLAKLRYALRASMDLATELEAPFLKRCTQWMTERLKKESRWQCWVAEDDQQLIGCLWLQLIEKIPNPVSEPEHHAYVTNFYVQESVRGKGIGSRLLSTAIEWCRSHDVNAVILWPTDQSRSLYIRNGFAVRDDLMELILASATTGSFAVSME